MKKSNHNRWRSAGMMAAIQSASCGCDVTIVEKKMKN